MTKNEFLLTALSACEGASFTPVQLQKMLFLLDTEAADTFGGPHFDFQPYHYGPFDKGVYEAADDVSELGLLIVDSNTSSGLRRYALTPAGEAQGKALLESLPEPIKGYIQELGTFVQNSSFASLVSTIYKNYPSMKVNSVFSD